MRFILSAFLAFSLLFAASAHADQAVGSTSVSTVFPPSDCNSASSILSWVIGDSTTRCKSGQDILRDTLNCTEGQSVVYENSKYTCKTTTTENPPSCGASEVLTHTSAGYSCVSSNVPTCTSNQVLTFNGSAFICVARTDSIPTCAANQFLTYNGSSFQCAATQNITIPVCGSGQYVSSNGTNFTCENLPALTLPTCAANQYVASDNGVAVCRNLPIAAGAPCRPVQQPYSPAGYGEAGSAGSIPLRDYLHGEIISAGMPGEASGPGYITSCNNGVFTKVEMAAGTSWNSH